MPIASVPHAANNFGDRGTTETHLSAAPRWLPACAIRTTARYCRPPKVFGQRQKTAGATPALPVSTASFRLRVKGDFRAVALFPREEVWGQSFA